MMKLSTLRKKLHKKSLIQFKVYVMRFFKTKERLYDAIEEIGCQFSKALTCIELCEEFREELIDYICAEYSGA